MGRLWSKVDLGRVGSGRMSSPVMSTEVEGRLRSVRWSGRVDGRVESGRWSGRLGSMVEFSEDNELDNFLNLFFNHFLTELGLWHYH